MQEQSGQSWGALPTVGAGAAAPNSIEESVTIAIPEPPKPKDIWDKADIAGKLLGSILIPVGIAATGFFVNMALQDRAAKQKAVEIAITVLQSKDPTIPELRGWARGVFNEMLGAANQTLSPAAQKELDNTPLPSPTGMGGAVVPRSTSAIATFFARYQDEFGRMMPTAVSNLTQLFTFIAQDTSMTDVRHVAYVLATIRHETNDTFEPTSEFCSSAHCEPYGERYKGRGYLLLTFARNYKTVGDILNVDLLNYPEKALDPQVAYGITSIGMERGLFTGKKLSDYIAGDKADYVHARQVVNGMDRAQSIAGDAERFEAILRDSLSVEKRASRPATTP